MNPRRVDFISILQVLPLLIAYIAYPIINIFLRVNELDFSRNWIDILWILFGYFAITIILFKGRISSWHKGRFLVGISFFFFFMLALMRFITPFFRNSVDIIPYLMEVKPVFYLSFAFLWTSAFGALKESQFVRIGAFLGLIVVVDFLLESYIAGFIVRPRGSGEINYDACLLLISLCMTWGREKPKASAVVCILLGLVMTLSRTALASAILLTLFFGLYKKRSKVLVFVLFLAFIIYSFQIRELPLDSLQSMDRYWMWKTAIELLRENPLQALIGFPLGMPLPVDVYDEISWLWNFQAEGWNISGVFPFSFHSFWLRIAISWGVIITFLLLVVTLVVFLGKRFSIIARSMAMLILFEGLTMGLFFLSNVGIPLMLAIILGFSMSKKNGDRNRYELHSRYQGLSK